MPTGWLVELEYYKHRASGSGMTTELFIVNSVDPEAAQMGVLHSNNYPDGATARAVAKVSEQNLQGFKPDEVRPL